jgi:hypothetical protein
MLSALLLWGLVAGQSPQLWQYTDSHGVPTITNDYASIPAKYRPDAAPLELSGGSTQAEAPAGDGQARAEALAQLQAGRLTDKEVESLIEKGVLRRMDLGVPINPEKTRPPPLPQGDMAADIAAARHEALAGQLGPITQIRQAVTEIRASPKFTYALYGQGALLLLMILALPFVLRRYHEESTRRVVRFAFASIFIIVSITGQLVVFKNELVQVFSTAQVMSVHQ